MGGGLCKLYSIHAEINQDLEDLKKQKKRILSKSNSSEGSLDREELHQVNRQIHVVEKSLGTVERCIEDYEETLTF